MHFNGDVIILLLLLLLRNDTSFASVGFDGYALMEHHIKHGAIANSQCLNPKLDHFGWNVSECEL